MIRYALFASLALAAPALFFACSGTTATSATGGVTDASSADVSQGASPGDGDGGGADASPLGAQDSAATDSAAPVSCAAKTGTSCLECCSTQYPEASAQFTALVKTCACSAEVCGPLEAGASDASDEGGEDGGDAGDAGPFGQGACATECTAGATSSSASSTCTSCLHLSLGSTSSPGTCAPAAEQCIGIPACAPFFECVIGCQ